MDLKKVIRNERGVATIEFLAMLPLVFFIDGFWNNSNFNENLHSTL